MTGVDPAIKSRGDKRVCVSSRGLTAGSNLADSSVMKTYAVYIMASAKNGTLYIGMTNNIVRRVFEHKEGLIDGFTKTYNVHTLVYVETHDDVVSPSKEKNV